MTRGYEIYIFGRYFEVDAETGERVHRIWKTSVNSGQHQVTTFESVSDDFIVTVNVSTSEIVMVNEFVKK